MDDFFKDGCHVEECENNRLELEYIAARSRMNGAAVAFGIIGMFEAIRKSLEKA